MKNDLTCGLVRDLLPSYVDGLLGPESREAVDRHLADCPGCSAALAAMLFRLIPFSSPASVYLTEQTEAIAQLDFHQAITLSAVAAWGMWLVFLSLTVYVVQKNSGKGRRNVV